MKNIGSIQNINRILKENELFAKKKFGQNFLVDQNILQRIVEVSEINSNVNVIEIGPGLGSLTEYLCQKANKVLCYEIDQDMIDLLEKNLEYDNYHILHKDILKANVNEDIATYFDDKPVYLVANLPYYITTPIILKLLEETNRIKKYTMMMQYEVAMRIASKPNVKDYNALSILIAYKARATKALDVPRTVFIPAPNVDSAVVVLDLYDKPRVSVKNEDFFLKLIKGAFAQRRKTLINNLMQMNIPKEKALLALEKMNLDKAIRSEALSIEDFARLSDILLEMEV